MNIIKSYSNLITKYVAKNPTRSLKMINLGLSLELTRLNYFSGNSMPLAYKKLNSLCVKLILDALKNPENSAWVNLFAPTEILHAFCINPISIEALSSFISGFECEDFFINYAESEGIADTLCSYHKCFIGASQSKLLPKPKFALTTSMICDANINTFRYLTEKNNIPSYVIDVPYEYSKENEAYVVKQLKELILMLEKETNKKFDIEKLRNILINENKSKKYLKDFLKHQRFTEYPSSLTLQMYMLFTSHISIGTKETLDFYKLLSQDIKKYPKLSEDALKIFWVHLLPFNHEALKTYFNFNSSYQIQGYDLNLDYLEEMDVEDPLKAIAKKMLLNIYNGSYSRKIDCIQNLIKELDADAAINFCHLGCKQSSGGVMLLKEKLQKRGIPLLIIDGDGIDRRNNQEGQIKTRLQAFFEIIEKKKRGDIL